ncbi:MAG TPA: hypothetical protein VMV34_09160 [Terriglobia bacterium]|nr:hypothetical protein [Terriglobia bacterium]
MKKARRPQGRMNLRPGKFAPQEYLQVIEKYRWLKCVAKKNRFLKNEAKKLLKTKDWHQKRS